MIKHHELVGDNELLLIMMNSCPEHRLDNVTPNSVRLVNLFSSTLVCVSIKNICSSVKTEYVHLSKVNV